jgi:hypothetical protein
VANKKRIFGIDVEPVAGVHWNQSVLVTEVDDQIDQRGVRPGDRPFPFSVQENSAVALDNSIPFVSVVLILGGLADP